MLRPARLEEVELVDRLRALSFGADGDVEPRIERIRDTIARGEQWGWDAGDGLQGVCRLSRVDHWFGGARVPTQNIAGVAVPPEARGRGVASAMMRAAAQRGVADGLGLSLLFPATTRFYRRLGWEHAGTITWARLDARHAPVSTTALRPARSDEWDAIVACNRRWAALHNGPAERPAARWAPLRDTRFHYVLDGPSGPGGPGGPCGLGGPGGPGGPGGVAGFEAYVLFDHQRTPDDWQYTLRFDDWAALTARGMAAVIGLVGVHGTLGKDAMFGGTTPDLWTPFLPEQDVTIDDGFCWMARGLDLPAAVAARGFPAGLSGAVTLAIDDPLLETRGRWRLEVADGRGVLEPAGAADVTLDVRGVGPLFTGFRDPAALHLAGLIDGPAEALAWLHGAFAGTPPFLVDFF